MSSRTAPPPVGAQSANADRHDQSVLDVAPQEAKEFIATHNLARDVAHAETLAKQHAPNGNVSLRLMQDPESATAERWLVLDVAVPEPVSSVLAASDRLLDEWIAATTPATRELICIHFSIA